jgi:UDP:flavonoid glycosyltransferase YjiC (YdhE family)
MRQRRKFLLVPTGSAGDVRPFVWLGEGLQSRGHEVCALVHAPFGDLMHAAQLRAVSYGTAEDFDAMARHPDLWHPRRGFELLARMSERWYRHVVPRLREEIATDRTTLLAPPIAFGARLAAEAFQLPLVTVQLQPATFFSVMDPPVLRAGWEWFGRLPRWVRRWIYRRAVARTDAMLAEGLNTYRHELGLGQLVNHIMRGYWMSPHCVLTLFPDWFAPRQSDWPRQTILGRFPPREAGKSKLHPELETFLAQGEPPVLFAPGSANAQAREFLVVAQQTCERLNRRGLLVTPYREQLPPNLSHRVTHLSHAPFPALMPRCAAVVHHGGIGTLAEALAAGRPQLAMPMSHDQPDNAARMHRLGVGDYLYPRRFTVTRVAQRLEELLGSDKVAQQCRRYQELMNQQIPPEDVFRAVEAVT